MINFRIAVINLVLVFLFSVIPFAFADEFSAIRDKVEECSSCHGERGASENPDVPILGGQEFYYLYVQLKDYKLGSRKNEIMSEIASSLEKPEMKLLAKYFSIQSWKNIGYQANTEDALRGERAANSGQCVQCHLGSYEGNSRVPRLKGQYPEYLKTTMLNFKYKKRLNSPAKSSLFVSYSDEDISYIAQYLAGM